MAENMKKVPDSAVLAEEITALAEGKLAENIISIDLGGETAVADYFVICSANSEPQLNAVVSAVERGLREKYNLRPHRVSGESTGGWVVIDYIDVVVHVMTAEARSRYDLEGLWLSGKNGNAGDMRLLAEKRPR